MNTKKFASVAVVLAALCLGFLFPYRAFAQVVEDDTKGVCVPASAYAKCKADVATCQKSAKELEEQLKKCNQELKDVIVPKPTETAKPTETVKPIETAKPTPKVTTTLPLTSTVPTVVKPKCDACEEIDKLKKRLGALEALVAEHVTHKIGGGGKAPNLDGLLKELEDLKKELEGVNASLGDLNKKLDRLLEEYVRLLLQVGVHDEFIKGIRDKLCRVTVDWEWTSEKVKEFCGATQFTVDVSVHGVADFYAGSPAQHYGVEAKVSGTFFPGSGPTGFIAGAGFGMLWGSKWAEDRVYRVSPFAGVEACTAQDRRTCFQVKGVFNIYTWAGRANDSQLPPTLRNKFETSFGWAFGLGVGFKHHFTKGLWFGLDATPKVTPGKNSWSFSPNGSPVVMESKGVGIDVGIGLGGTIDVF